MRRELAHLPSVHRQSRSLENERVRTQPVGRQKQNKFLLSYFQKNINSDQDAVHPHERSFIEAINQRTITGEILKQMRAMDDYQDRITVDRTVKNKQISLKNRIMMKNYTKHRKERSSYLCERKTGMKQSCIDAYFDMSCFN